MTLKIQTYSEIIKDEAYDTLVENVKSSVEENIGNREALLQDVLLALRFSGYHIVKDDEITPTLMR